MPLLKLIVSTRLLPRSWPAIRLPDTPPIPNTTITTLIACPAMIDGTIVTAHQKASGAKGGTEHQAIGRSRGGLTTKIVALVDALGNLVRFVLLPGQTHDLIGVKPLIQDIEFDMLLVQKS